MRAVAVLLLAVGCAKGGAPISGEDASADPVDSTIRRDSVESFDDAAIDGRPIDGPVDAYVPDSPPDACIPIQSEVLVNPVFDMDANGTGWTQQVIDPAYPLITDQDGVPEQSAPRKAWLGGFEAPNVGQNVTDVLSQTVTIPANTTAVVLTGFYEVRSGEDAGSTNVYDTGQLALTMPNGTPIVTVLALSNRTPTAPPDQTSASWAPINHVVTQNLAGQQVVVRMTTSNDFSLATSFYFDTLSLKVTHCP